MDRYTCEEAFRRLDDFIDRELSEEEQRLVREHLEVCAMCAGEFEFEAAVLCQVRERLRRIDTPPGLIDRITRALGPAQE